MGQRISAPRHALYDEKHHWPGYTAFWTLLRRARLCPNCEAIFDSSFTYCPACGAQHLFDTISLLQVLNRAQAVVNKRGETEIVKTEPLSFLQAFNDEKLRLSLVGGPAILPANFEPRTGTQHSTWFLLRLWWSSLLSRFADYMRERSMKKKSSDHREVRDDATD